MKENNKKNEFEIIEKEVDSDDWPKGISEPTKHIWLMMRLTLRRQQKRKKCV